jgi:hypothetical protein
MGELIKENKLLKIKNEQLEAKVEILEKHIDNLLTPVLKTNVVKENNPRIGSYLLRSKEGKKIYHGCTTSEATWTDNPSKFNHKFFVYDDNYVWRSYHHPDKWDIRNRDITKFCDNCELDSELSKRKRVLKIYTCLGHDL